MSYLYNFRTSRKFRQSLLSGSGQVFPLEDHYGFIAAVSDPLHFAASSTIGNDDHFLTKVWIPGGKEIAKLWAAVMTGQPWGGVTGGNELTLYDVDGNLIDTTASDETLWTAAGWRGGPLTGGNIPAAVEGRFVYVGIHVRGMSAAPNFGFANQTDSPWFHHGPGATERRSMVQSGTVNVPASFDPTSYGIGTGYTPHVAVSDV
jgi:hypothetical protein